ncbi:PAS domain S-box protein [Candidatus Nitrospira bockiana]
MSRVEDPGLFPYRRLPVLIAGLLAVAVLAAVFLRQYMATSLLDRTGQALAVAASDIAERLDQILFERYGDIQMMALAFQSRDLPGMRQYLDWMMTAYPYYRWIAVADVNGRIVAATKSERLGQDASGAAWFQEGRHKVVIYDVRPYDETDGIMAVAFAAPIRDPTGRLKGVVTSRVWLPVLEDVFARTLREAQQGGLPKLEYLFLSRTGELIADSFLREEGRVNLKELGLASARVVTETQAPGYVEERRRHDGVPVITGYARTHGYADFPDPQWAVLVRVDRDAVLVPFSVFFAKVGLVGMLVSVPLFGLLWWTTRRLKAEWHRTRESERWLFTTLSSIGDAVITTDAAGRVTFMNPVAGTLTGWKDRDAEGRPLEEVFRIVNEATRLPVESPVHKVLRAGIVVGLANHTVLIARDGSEHPIDDSGAPIRNEQGGIIGVVLVFRDVSEQRAAEEALRESEERFRLMVESVRDYAIFMLDPEGYVTTWNAGAERIKGYRTDEIVGRHFSCFYTPDDRDAGRPQQNLAMAASQGRYEEEGWRVRKDGSRFMADAVLTAIRDGAGRLKGFVKVTRDVTERKEAERAIQESRDFYLKLFDEFPALVWRAGVDGTCNYFNRAWLVFTGRTLEEEQGDGWVDGVHPEDVERCTKTYREAFEARTSFRMVYRLRRHDGEYREVVDHGSPFYGLDGTFAGYVGSCYDVTEQRQAEARLRESERQLSKAQGLAHLGSWAWDIKTNTVQWSEELYRIYGIEPGTAISYERVLEAVHPADRAAFDARVRAALDDHRPFEFYHRIRRPDGAERVLHAHGEVLLEGGRVVGMFGTGQDVTELKQAEAALKQAHDELERRVEERTKELARVNQELIDKVQDLEKFHDVVVGRELRMMELEQEIERLKRRHAP